MSWERSVYSRMAQAIGYDSDTQELIVTWSNGRRSAYAGVPEDVAEQCANAASVGTFLNDVIKPTYGHRYV